MSWTHILSACAVVSVVGGAAGLVGGWRASQADGPDVLMHYPPPFIWMRKRLMSARWVMRLGAMYVLAGFTLWVVGLQTDGDASQANLDRTCAQLTQALTRPSWSPVRWTTRPVPTHQPGCSAQLIDAEGVRWFSIRSFPARGMIGEHFRQETVDLERKAMALKPISGIGDRAVMATPRSKVVTNPTLVFADESGTHILEMNVQRVKIDRVLDVLRTTNTGSM